MAETVEYGVGINFSARDLASGPIGLLSNNFKGLQTSMAQGMPRILQGFGSLAAGAAATSAGMGTLRGAFNLATFAGSFNQEMAAVRSITQASAEDFDALNEAAIEAGIVTKFTPEEAAGGLRVLSQQGLVAQDAINGLVPVLDFAAAGNIEVAEAAEVAMGVMNAYGMEVDNMTSVTDRLMRGTQISALSADEFITVMGRAASSGKVFGSNLDDVIISLGSMRSSGIPATVATTALGEAMRRLTTDTNTAEILDQFNVAMEDSQGNLRSVIDVTHDFQQAISHLSEAEQARLVSQAFGVRGMREFSAISNISARVMRDGELVTIRGAEAIAHYRQQLEEAGGTTERFRRDRAATFAGQMELLSGATAAFKTVLGEAFGEAFAPLISMMTKGISALVTWWQGLSDGSKKVIAVITLAVGVLLLIGGVILIVSGAITILGTAMGALVSATLALAGSVTVALLPVIAIIAAIIAVGYLLYKAYQTNFYGFRDFINNIGVSLRNFFVWMRDGLVQFWENTKEVARYVVMVLSDMWQSIRTAPARAMAYLRTVFNAIMNSPIIAFFRRIIGYVQSFIGLISRALAFVGRIIDMTAGRTFRMAGQVFRRLTGGDQPNDETLEGTRNQMNSAAGTTARVRAAQRRTAEARPAEAEASGRRESTERVLERIEAGQRRGQGSTTIQNDVNLRIDGRQLSNVMQEVSIDDRTGAGGVVTDEFGFSATPA